MQFTLAFVAAALATLAVASPTPSGPTCSTGPIKCCQSVGAASSTQIAKELGLLNIVIGNLNDVVGLQCTNVAGSSWYAFAIHVFEYFAH